MTPPMRPVPASPSPEDDLIERCARAARDGYPVQWNSDYDKAHENTKDKWRRVARAVLSEAAAQPPAPITAEDVRAAEDQWDHSAADWEGATDESGWAAFVADYLNRRGER